MLGGMSYRLSNAQDVTHHFTGADLCRWRKAAGLSRRELAERAGCSQSMIRNLERGDLPRRSFVLPAILRVLDEAVGASGAAIEEQP